MKSSGEIENRAAVLDEYQPSFRQSSWLEPSKFSVQDEYIEYFQEMDRARVDEELTICDKIYIKVVAMRFHKEDFRGMTAHMRGHFFSNISVPFCPTTRCTAWAKRASSQGSVTSSRTPLS